MLSRLDEEPRTHTRTHIKLNINHRHTDRALEMNPTASAPVQSIRNTFTNSSFKQQVVLMNTNFLTVFTLSPPQLWRYKLSINASTFHVQFREYNLTMARFCIFVNRIWIVDLMNNNTFDICLGQLKTFSFNCIQIVAGFIQLVGVVTIIYSAFIQCLLSDVANKWIFNRFFEYNHQQLGIFIINQFYTRSINRSRQVYLRLWTYRIWKTNKPEPTTILHIIQ